MNDRHLIRAAIVLGVSVPIVLIAAMFTTHTRVKKEAAQQAVAATEILRQQGYQAYIDSGGKDMPPAKGVAWESGWYEAGAARHLESLRQKRAAEVKQTALEQRRDLLAILFMCGIVVVFGVLIIGFLSTYGTPKASGFGWSIFIFILLLISWLKPDAPSNTGTYSPSTGKPYDMPQAHYDYAKSQLRDGLRREGLPSASERQTDEAVQAIWEFTKAERQRKGLSTP